MLVIYLLRLISKNKFLMKIDKQLYEIKNFILIKHQTTHLYG